MNVMNAVTMVVDSLDDIPKLVNELKTLGESHGRHNIQVSHFRVIIQPFHHLYNIQFLPFLVDYNQS